MNEEYTWTVRISAATPDHLTANVRSHRLTLGVPISFDSAYGVVTSLEHFLAAVGSDILGGLFIRAKRKRLEIYNAEATIDCSLNNPLTFLDVVGEEGSPGIKRLSMIVYISTFAAESEIQQLWEDTLRKSPMVQTLQKALTLDLSYKVVL
jgi:hypothetical protein